MFSSVTPPNIWKAKLWGAGEGRSSCKVGEVGRQTNSLPSFLEGNICPTCYPSEKEQVGSQCTFPDYQAKSKNKKRGETKPVWHF